jgi:hypothetical protein
MNNFSSLHGDIFCNDCKELIEGIRYMCLDCEDFDMCASCEEDLLTRSRHYGGKHLFAKIYNSLNMGGEEFLDNYRLSNESEDSDY